MSALQLVAGSRWRARPSPGRSELVATITDAGGGAVLFRLDSDQGHEPAWRLPERAFLDAFEPIAPAAAAAEPERVMPCSRRIGEWWCYRTDPHVVPDECRTPPPRPLPRNDFKPVPNNDSLRGRARRLGDV